MSEPREFVTLTPEQVRARNKRSLVIALSLAGFMALVFAVTLAQMGANVLVRPL